MRNLLWKPNFLLSKQADESNQMTEALKKKKKEGRGRNVPKFEI